MNYQKEKDARVEKMARLVENYLCDLVAKADDEHWWELYQAAYDFMDEASVNRFSPCDRLCKLDRRPPE
jgi:hypothetical protein